MWHLWQGVLAGQPVWQCSLAADDSPGQSQNAATSRRKACRPLTAFPIAADALVTMWPMGLAEVGSPLIIRLQMPQQGVSAMQACRCCLMFWILNHPPSGMEACILDPADAIPSIQPTWLPWMSNFPSLLPRSCQSVLPTVSACSSI